MTIPKKACAPMSPPRRFVWAVLFSCGLLLLSLLLLKVTFLNNDDTNILYVLAGYRTGTPYPSHRFIHAALGICISFLYRVLPGVPWWAVYQLTMILLSLSVICSCMVKIGQKNGLSLWAVLAAFLLMYGTMFVYNVLWIAFTTTSGMLGTAAAALLLSADLEKDAPGESRRIALWSALFMVLSFFTRNSSGISMACFFGAALLYQILINLHQRKFILQLAGYGALCVLLFAGVMALNSYGILRLNSQEYVDFEEARGAFTDYPHITYADDPALFAAMGWDESVYTMADNLCFLDAHETAEAMNAVMAAPIPGEKSILGKLAAALATGIAFFRGSGVAQYMLVVPVLLFCWLILLCRKRKHALPGLLIGIATAGGAFLLCFYLCYTGRFPLRTFRLIAVPAAVLLLLLCLSLWDGVKRSKALSIAAGSITALGLCWSLWMGGNAALSYDKTALAVENAAVESYCIAHPENVYLTDVTSVENVAAFTVYPGEKPVNLVDWGGTAMHSHWKNLQLAQNGISDFSGKLFARENVYFIAASDNASTSILDGYLRSHEQSSGYERVDAITERIFVYRFLFGGDAQ